jgi:carbon monoxide dehydrogenase subunit G
MVSSPLSSQDRSSPKEDIMPLFKGSHEETFTLSVPIEQAKEIFGGLDNIIECYGNLEKGEKLDDRTIHFLLKPQSAMGVNFQGDYRAEYNFVSDTRLEWQSKGSGNMHAKGSVDFKALGDNKTQLTYRQNMECDIPVNRLLGKALAPIVSKSISSGIKEFLGRMKGRGA